MKKNKHTSIPVRSNFILIVLCVFLLGSCTISYKFNGASIDYTKTKTISISDFPNMAELVYAPLSNMFSEGLKDKYTKQTKLQLLNSGGDLDLQGEIVGYDLTPLAVGTDSYSQQVKLTLTVNVRFQNVKNPADDFEKRYSASQVLEADFDLNAPDEPLGYMIEDITDQIYNETVAKW